jgi:hypothetical protein
LIVLSQCQELGRLIASEIDALKTGVQTQLDNRLKPPSSGQSVLSQVSEKGRLGMSFVLDELREMMQAYLVENFDNEEVFRDDISDKEMRVLLKENSAAWSPFESFQAAVKWSQVISFDQFEQSLF